MADLAEASADKVTVEHGVIDEAIQDRGQGYTVFSIVRSITPEFTNDADSSRSPLVSSLSVFCIVHQKTS